MVAEREFTVAAHEAGQRLDHVLRRRYPDVSRRLQLGWFVAKSVYLDDAIASKGETVSAGQRCRIPGGAPQNAELDREPGAVQPGVLWQDENVVVVDKPAGMASTVLTGSKLDSVAAHLLEWYPEMNGIGYSPGDAGLIHRLDTDTSGVMVAAKTRAAFDELVGALRAGHLTKTYLAWTGAAPMVPSGVITSWLRSDPKHKRRMSVARPGQAGAKPCETLYEVLGEQSGVTLIRATAALATRHQVRVHLASIGSSLLGDTLYGGAEAPGLTRHALHAERVSYAGGETCRAFDCRAAVPADLASLMPLGF